MSATAEADGGAPSLAAIILTFNEERHIERAIDSLAGLAREVLVVDSYSTDETVRLAAARGARVLQNPFVHQAQQFQWALAHGGVATDWILRLDADEVIEADLAAALRAFLPRAERDVVGINLRRKHVFMDRWLKHGGLYPLLMLRIWRNGHAQVEDKWMDEHIVVTGGRTITVAGGFADISLHGLDFFTDKHNRYATREAIEVLGARHDLFPSRARPGQRLGARQTRFKRWMKTRIYNRLPLAVGPTAYFLFRYVARLGFLDGRPGLIYHVLQGFWYRFLVNAKVAEFEVSLAACASREERLERLATLSGYDLVSWAAEPASSSSKSARKRSATLAGT